MEKNNYSVLISTCDKFSDLWDANVLLINENWADRNADTYLVTDKPSDRTFSQVKLIAGGEGAEITERLQVVLREIDTPYIVFTLDDYFLTEKIDTAAIQKDIAFMAQNDIDYLRIYPCGKKRLRQVKAVKSDTPGIYFRDPNEGDYAISLYPGIWKADFMRKTLGEVRNAWQYEVALTGMARDLKARLAVSENREFPFLDVIRKGKLLRKAKRYFDKNPIYQSEREVMKAKDEWMLSFRTVLRTWLPAPLMRALKNRMRKKGHTFFSDGQ